MKQSVPWFSALLIIGSACGATQSAPLPEEPCDTGSTCFSVAHELHSDGRYAQATPLFVQACAFNHIRGCHVAGNMYRLGRGVERDPCRASQYYRRACNTDYPEACHALAQLRSERAGCLPPETNTVDSLREEIEALHARPPRR